MSRYRLGSMLCSIVALLATAAWCVAAPARAKITSPQAGEVVRGPRVAIRVWFDASKAAPVRGWQLTIDGEHHTMKRFETPLREGRGTLWWDTTGFAPGEHAVRVHLYRYGREIGIAGVRVRLAGDGAEETGVPGPLATVPVSAGVRIGAPQAGAQVWGQLLVTVHAQPPEGAKFQWIQLYADDRLVGLVNSRPYEIAINTGRLVDGEHVLVALAIDDAGQRHRSTPVAIRVANGDAGVAEHGPTPPPSVRPAGGGPALTESIPRGGGGLVIGYPDLEEPPPIAAAEPRLIPPGEAASPTSPAPVAIAPVGVIKPYLPGRSDNVGPSSAVGAPGLSPEPHEE